jgi:hypothetical protein
MAIHCTSARSNADYQVQRILLESLSSLVGAIPWLVLLTDGSGRNPIPSILGSSQRPLDGHAQSTTSAHTCLPCSSHFSRLTSLAQSCARLLGTYAWLPSKDHLSNSCMPILDQLHSNHFSHGNGNHHPHNTVTANDPLSRQDMQAVCPRQVLRASKRNQARGKEQPAAIWSTAAATRSDLNQQQSKNRLPLHAALKTSHRTNNRHTIESAAKSSGGCLSIPALLPAVVVAAKPPGAVYRIRSQTVGGCLSISALFPAVVVAVVIVPAALLAMALLFTAVPPLLRLPILLLLAVPVSVFLFAPPLPGCTDPAKESDRATTT